MPNNNAEQMVESVIREARAQLHKKLEEAGLTQTQLAELVGLPSSSVQRALAPNGNQVPSLRQLCQIADGLGVQLYIVVDG